MPKEKNTHGLKKFMDGQNLKKTMDGKILQEVVKKRKKKIWNLKVWGSQAHFRQMRQARDAKQSLNGRHHICLFSVI